MRAYDDETSLTLIGFQFAGGEKGARLQSSSNLQKGSR